MHPMLQIYDLISGPVTLIHAFISTLITENMENINHQQHQSFSYYIKIQINFQIRPWDKTSNCYETVIDHGVK